jgi:DNA repair photolyase
MFRQGLALHYPDRAGRVMARVQELHGGRDYDADFATRMKGQGVWADLLRQRFAKTCARLGLNAERAPLDSRRFDPAALRMAGATAVQRELF